MAHPGALPAELLAFAKQALDKAQSDPHLLGLLMGEYLTEPKANVWFEQNPEVVWAASNAVRLDRRTRMMYDDRHVFINGEGFRVAGQDGRLLRQLADERALSAAACARFSADARAALLEWAAAGWLRFVKTAPPT